MDVLVIGGTGLISTAIVRGLLGAGHEVTCYTRGESDRTLPPEVAHVRGDRTDHDHFEAQMADRDFECVIDMWCMERADARSAVRAFGGEIEQYVFCSTVDIYETSFETYPVTEDASRIRPGEGYAPEKAGCEKIVEDAHAADAFEATIVRPWYTYGEGRGIVGTVDAAPTLARLRAGEPILVHGDGTAMWAGTHRDDVARAFVGAVGTEAAFGEAYHTGHAAVGNCN
jgi:nucleoside-diphosphate-sugar epimerase